VEKVCRAKQATDGNMAHGHCMLDSQAKNTHSTYVILTAFRSVKMVQERASLLCHTYSTLPLLLRIATA
jgi:hypothetical protein